MKLTKIPMRHWINQPSESQPCHKWHGKNVLAIDDGNKMARIFFTQGGIVSARIPILCISEGWVDTK